MSSKMNISAYAKEVNMQIKLENMFKSDLQIQHFDKLHLKDKSSITYYNQVKKILTMQLKLANKAIHLSNFATKNKIVLNDNSFRQYVNISKKLISHVKSFGTTESYIASTVTYKLVAASFKHKTLQQLISLNNKMIKQFKSVQKQFEGIEKQLNEMQVLTESHDILLEINIKDKVSKMFNKIKSGFKSIILALLEGWEFIIRGLNSISNTIHSTINNIIKGVTDNTGRLLFKVINKINPELAETLQSFVDKASIEGFLGKYAFKGAVALLNIFGGPMFRGLTIGFTAINYVSDYIIKANGYLDMKDALVDTMNAGLEIAKELDNLDLD